MNNYCHGCKNRQDEIERLRAALTGILAVRPYNWDDDDDPEMVAAWQAVDAALTQPCPDKPSQSGGGIAAELPDHVLAICFAYEAGFGHAGRDLCNPYSRGSDEWHAYAYGKTEGESRSEDQS